MPLTTSIVLCTYNGARFLPAQWASLLAQSRRPDEIVVRDDASTDGTPGLLADLAVKTQAHGIPVRYIRGDRNLGYVANFEAALRAASSDLLFLCDQDDAWHPGKLATQLVEFERRPELLLLCGNARRVGADGADLGPTLFDVLRMTPGELRRIHAGRGFAVLLRRSMATGATVALRRELLADALPFPAAWIHDEWLAIVAAALGGFDCLEAPLVDYRQHGGNQIGMRERGLLDKWYDLRRSRSALLEELVTRMQVLDDGLRKLGGRVSPGRREAVARALDHWRARLAIRGAPWWRVGPIVRETANGGYRLYGSGWRSVVRDLLRQR